MSSIEHELTGEVMAILKGEEPKVAVMVAAMVLIKSLMVAVENGEQDVAIGMLKEAMEIADRMKGGRTQ
jgi:hypothetical protein